jgi:formylmethanofuran dehydrogenase subunit D
MSQGPEPELFIPIPGRTSRQGTSLNEGKFSTEYVDETSTLLMSPEDMARLGLNKGNRVRLRTAQGQIELLCQAEDAVTGQSVDLCTEANRS